MRLGDLDEAKKIAQEFPSDPYHVITACAVIDKTPTIDPDSLPIVRQLREELSNCKQELRQIKYCYDMAKNGEKQFRKQNDKIVALWAECAKKLKQVTTERGAAVICEELEEAQDAIDAAAGVYQALWNKVKRDENATVLVAILKRKAEDAACECVQLAAMAQKMIDSMEVFE